VERILCLDYGKVRTGIAVTDPLQIIVVGYPLQLNGTKSDTTIMVDDFIGLLKKWYPTKKVDVIDERLSSIEANNIIIRSGVKKSKRKKKGLIDKI